MDDFQLTLLPHDGGFCEECGKEQEALFTANVTRNGMTASRVLCRECAQALSERLESRNAEQPPQTRQTPQGGSETVKVLKDTASNVAEKVKSNTFVKAIHADLQRSETLKTVRKSVSETAGKVRADLKKGAPADSSHQPAFFGTDTGDTATLKTGSGKKWKTVAVLAIIAAAIILILALCLHHCEICGDLYFGFSHKLRFMGEERWMHICGDCYDKIKDIF